MRLGAEVCRMTYVCVCKSLNTERLCITPKNMRESFIEDGSLRNIKCLHWMINELPSSSTHEDVLPQRMTHMDVVVKKVERAMNITWAPKKEVDKISHQNCIQHVYSKILNDKKQTIINEDRTTHQRKPNVRRPKTFADSKHTPNFKKGMTLFSWKRKMEGEHSVSTMTVSTLIECIMIQITLNHYCFTYQKVYYDQDRDWSQWNMAAKRRILMEATTITSAPMPPYFVEQNMTGSAATHVSSLESNMTSASDQKSAGQSTSPIDKPQQNHHIP
jgi:hypothetical protein